MLDKAIIFINNARHSQKPPHQPTTMKMKLLKSVFCACLAGGTLSLAPLANATVVDLTNDTVGTSGTINGATFQIVAPQPSGTGVIDPFLTVQNSPVEQ